ncbi:MAG: IS4 family transposase [Deltaproteobacteria bacterium]|nr:IS4 family transposase [Deltaproteobacteria bacterium]
MARPKSIKLRDRLVKMFPPSLLDRLARETGAVVRRRKVAANTLFWTVVLGFGLGRIRTIAGLRRSYEKATGQTIEESSFYNRLSEGFARMLRAAITLAFDTLPGVGHALEGPLAAFRDLVVTDSTVMRLRDLLEGPFPACRTNHTQAALKMHTVLSVNGAGDNSIRITAERRHDGPVFRVGRWVRGRLLLFDLGYFRYQLFACITRNEGFFLSRLKRSANPFIVSVNRAHRGRTIDLVGKHLNDVLGDLARDVLDVMVEVSFTRRAYGGRRSRGSQTLRVVGVRDPETKRYHLYVTNVAPEKLAAEDIRRVYAARWEVELLFRELKSQYRIEDLPSGKRAVVESLVYAAVLTLIASRRLLAEVRRKLGRLADRVPKQRWAAIFAAIAQDLLVLMARPPRETRLHARLVSEMVLHEAIDPNASRLSLIRAVETRTHVYHRKAA